MRKGSGFLINAGPTTIILAILRDQTLPGFDIAAEVERLSAGKLTLQQGTLYPLLNKLQKEGLVKSAWDLPENDNARRVYSLTEKGIAEAARQIDTWNEYVATIGQVLRGSTP